MIFVIVGFVDSFGMCKMCEMCKMCKCLLKCAKCAESIHFRSKILSRVFGTVRFEEHHCFFPDLNKVSVVFNLRLLPSSPRQKSRRADDLRKFAHFAYFAHFCTFCTFCTFFKIFTFGSLRRLLRLQVCGFAWMIRMVSVLWDPEI